MGAEHLASLTYGHHLPVGRRIVVDEDAVVSSGYDLAVLDDDTSEWTAMSLAYACEGFLDGHLHVGEFGGKDMVELGLGKGAGLLAYLRHLKLLAGSDYGLLLKALEEHLLESIEAFCVVLGKLATVGIAHTGGGYDVVVIVRPDKEAHAHVWGHEGFFHCFFI